MSLTTLPVTAADLLQLQLGIELIQNPIDATAEAAAITAGTDTVYGYAIKLLGSNISLSQVAMAVDALMFDVTDNIAELTKLTTLFLPAQAANAVANGLNPTVYAAEALGLALAQGNGTSNAFAANFGSLSVSAFAQAAASATGVNANAIQQFVNNWISFYTANPAATFGDTVTLAAYGAAFGDAVGVALLNATTANLQTAVPNALIDLAEGKYVVGAPLAAQPIHAALQGETLLSSALTGPLVLSNVPNGATLVANGFGAGNNLTVSGPDGSADAFTMTATSIQGQDWGTLSFSGFENVTLALAAGLGGFDLDLGAITTTPTIGGGDTLNFTGNANVYVSAGLVAPFGTGNVTLVGGGLINDTDSGVLHFGATTALKIVGTTGGGIIMGGIDTSPFGVQEFGSTTGWNNLAGSVLADTFNGGKGNVSPGGEGDILLTNGGADTINLAPGHSANHIEVYGGTGSQSSDGTTTVYNGTSGSITTSLGTAQPGFWGNTAAGATNDIFSAFAGLGTSATQVTVNGFNVGSDVIDLSAGAWPLVALSSSYGLVQAFAGVGKEMNPVRAPATGTPALISGELYPGGSGVSSSAPGTDVILFGGNFANAAALGTSLHINHYLALDVSGEGITAGHDWHQIGIYNDASNNAHIVDIAMKTTGKHDSSTIFTDEPIIEVAISDMVMLVGVNAVSLTGANIHFVT
jgi:hypothetical protein